MTAADDESATLRIRYFADGGKVFDDFVRTCAAGDAYGVTSPKLEGYTADQAVVSGILFENVTIDVTYRKNSFSQKVNYVFEDGTQAAPEVTGEYTYGESYSVETPALEGFKASVQSVAGTMPGRNVQVTVVYTAAGSSETSENGNGTIAIDEYETPLGLGSANLNMGCCIE